MNENIVQEEEEEVLYEEVPNPHVIETGDSIKVKQVLDDATISAITDAGYIANYSWENFKLFLMFISCVFAMVAQFFPLPFPASRPLLAVCCASYFVISSVLQLIVTFVDKDTILFTRPSKGFESEMQIRTSFARFQEFYDIAVEFKGLVKSPATTGKFYVGKYFTEKGEFDEESFTSDVKLHVERFVTGKYNEFQYNHKSD